MEQALRDPIWQFIGVAISLIALVVSVVAIRVQQRKKSLGYTFKTEQPILYVFDSSLKGRLTLSLDGKPVQGLSTYEVSIFNDGNVPITPSDFIEPLKIEFKKISKILAVAISESSPQRLPVTIEPNSSSYTVAPTLLNPGDEFIVQFLVDQSERDYYHYAPPAVTARITGVAELRLRKTNPSHGLYIGAYRFVLARATPPFALGVVASVAATWFFDLLTRLSTR